MPQYTENHVLLAWGGDAYEQQEIWSNSVRLKHIGGDAAGPMQADIQATLPDLVDAVVDYYNEPGSLYANRTRLTWVRANVISAATGKYFYPNDPILFELEPPVASTQGTGFPQLAACVTLRSNIRRGPAARGRWYIPLGFSPGSLTSTGVLPAQTCEIAANAAGAFLSRLSTISAGEGPDPWSPWLYGDGIGGPVDAAVQTVSVGNVADTQRRRRNSIAETYFFGEYDPVNG